MARALIPPVPGFHEERVLSVPIAARPVRAWVAVNAAPALSMQLLGDAQTCVKLPPAYTLLSLMARAVTLLAAVLLAQP